jgi:hypothetical protein
MADALHCHPDWQVSRASAVSEKKILFFPDITLARRLEFHEAWSSVEHARTQAQLFPETGAASMSIDGCSAVFCGEKSPLSQVYGLGLSGPVSATDLDAIETFYRNRDQKVGVSVCPLADTALSAQLSDREYGVQYFMNVYIRQVTPLNYKPPTISGLKITVASSCPRNRLGGAVRRVFRLFSRFLHS